MKLHFALVFIFTVLVRAQLAPGPLDLVVLYESLCSDSINFILNQLRPAYDKFGSKNIKLTLVPFGKANFEMVRNQLSFQCQHGSEECYGNIVQACAIDQLLDNPTKALQYVLCMEEGAAEIRVSPKLCAAEMSLNWEEIEVCATGSRGKYLHAINGLVTSDLVPELKFVPTVVINGEVVGDETAVLNDFVGLLCRNYLAEVEECQY